MDTLQAIIIAIVEGITEYLPISSTGHMILAQSFLGVKSDDFVKLFTVAIQLGAILAVVALYFKRFFQSLDFYFKLGVGFLPAAIIGFLANDYVDAMLESPLVVAISLLLGGVVLLFVDKWFNRDEQAQQEADSAINSRSKTQMLDQIFGKIGFKSHNPNYTQSLIVGLCQTIAMIPGVSRSAASIIGGMWQGLSRTTAAEFSFFLAVPTMLGATVYKLYKYSKTNEFSTEQIQLLAIGNVVAFVVAIIAIKFFIGYLQKYGFKAFGWYRIALGIVLLGMMVAGYSLEI